MKRKEKIIEKIMPSQSHLDYFAILNSANLISLLDSCAER